MAGFTSFEKLLSKYLIDLNPKTILEWGPGTSTAIMLKYCPEARIWSLEDNKQYHKIYTIRFSNFRNVFVKFVEGEKYWKLPENIRDKKFDLIFVDGNCDLRVKCLQTAHEVVSEDGVVLLHDSERIKYREGVELFKKLEELDGTVVLKK